MTNQKKRSTEAAVRNAPGLGHCIASIVSPAAGPVVLLEFFLHS
jgi:hypothetical protein